MSRLLSGGLEIELAGKHDANSTDQVGKYALLQHLAAGPGSQHILDKAPVGMHRQRKHLHRGVSGELQYLPLAGCQLHQD